MKHVLLDTDVIVDFLRAGTDHLGIIEGTSKREAVGYISAITHFELHNGALLSRDPKRKVEELGEMLEVMEVVCLGPAESYASSRIYSDLVRRGLSLEMRDILIAGCAVSRGLALLTNNRKHFERMPEVKFFKW